MNLLELSEPVSQYCRFEQVKNSRPAHMTSHFSGVFVVETERNQALCQFNKPQAFDGLVFHNIERSIACYHQGRAHPLPLRCRSFFSRSRRFFCNCQFGFEKWETFGEPNCCRQAVAFLDWCCFSIVLQDRAMLSIFLAKESPWSNNSLIAAVWREFSNKKTFRTHFLFKCRRKQTRTENATGNSIPIFLTTARELLNWDTYTFSRKHSYGVSSSIN